MLRIERTVYPDACNLSFNQRQAVMLLYRGEIKKFNEYCSSVGMKDADKLNCLEEVKLKEVCL